LPILTETFEGNPEGMNVSLPAQELPDTQARYMQDILVDYPGLDRRRGPIRKVPGSAESSDKISGIVQTLDPAGANRVALLSGHTTKGVFGFLNDTWSTITELEISKDSDVDLPATPPTNPYRIVDTKQARGGGSLVGISDTYNTTTNQALAYWRGARKADYSTGTITATLNSKVITGSGTSFTTNVEPGMFLFSGASAGTPRNYIGTVKSVDSGTQLTLENNALVAATAGSLAYSLQSRRGIVPKVMKGRITCTTTAATVTGANTKFKDQGIKGVADTWLLFKMSDGTFIGTITSVQSNTALTLTANAAQALSNERYFAVNVDQHYGVKLNLTSTNGASAKVGFLHAVYAERQWYANRGADVEQTSRIWFSDPLDLEGIDMSPVDGDFIPVGSARGSASPIRALQSAYNALLIMKEDETYALRGTSPSTFSVSKVHDDGCLAGMAVQSYGGGVIWPGRNSINYYNGVEVESLTQERLGDYYKNLIRSFNPLQYRMWSTLVRDHYILFIEDMSPPLSVIKGLKSSAPSQMAISIYMPTRGITFLRNFNIRGSVDLPADTGQSTWVVMNGYPSTLSEAGNTTAPTGFTPETLSNNRVVATGIGSPGDKAYARVSIYADGLGASAIGDCKMRLAVYQDNGSGLPGALLAESEENIIPAGSIAQWHDFDFAEWERVASGTGLHLAMIAEKVNHVRVWSAPHTGFSVAATPDRDYDLGMPDPFGAVHATNNKDKDYALKIWGATTSTIKGYIIDTGDLFDVEDRDDFGCDSGVPGPDFYYESKKFAAGDSLRKKLFKQLAMHYVAQGGPIKLDTVVGLNDQGQTRQSVFPPSAPSWDATKLVYTTWAIFAASFATWNAVTSAVFRARRLKFLKRSTHLAFRLYQGSCLMNRLKLGPYQVGYKLQRPGRI
jgi:hypothetical protein